MPFSRQDHPWLRVVPPGPFTGFEIVWQPTLKPLGETTTQAYVTIVLS